MRKLSIVLLTISALSSCNSVTGLDARELVISASCRTTFDPPPMPLPAVFKQVDTGTCQVAGRGDMLFRSTKYIDVQAGRQVTSELTLTAANGDVLRATGSGSNVPGAQGTINFTADLFFRGGTGEFEGRQGTASVIGSASVIQRTAQFTVEGRVGTVE